MSLGYLITKSLPISLSLSLSLSLSSSSSSSHICLQLLCSALWRCLIQKWLTNWPSDWLRMSPFELPLQLYSLHILQFLPLENRSIKDKIPASLVRWYFSFLIQVIYKSGVGLNLGGGRVIKRDTASVEQPPHTEGCRLQSIAMHCCNALSPFFWRNVWLFVAYV